MITVEPGAAGINEAERRFGASRLAGLTPVDLKEGDPGYSGIATAEARFGKDTK